MTKIKSFNFRNITNWSDEKSEFSGRGLGKPTIQARVKAKEGAVVDALQDILDLSNIEVKNAGNQIIGGSGRKPDIFKILKLVNLVIEVDEFQHKYYSKADEVGRMQAIAADFKDPKPPLKRNKKPTVFIRFNPDGYANIQGCWKESQLTDENQWKRRIKRLKQCIQAIKNEKTLQQGVYVCYLYFDLENRAG